MTTGPGPDLVRLAHAAAHDLRSPLNTLSNITQLLSRRYVLDQNGERYVRMLEDAVRSMSALLEGLLAYVEALSAGPTPGEASAADALEQATARLAAEIAGSGASVSHDPLPRVAMTEEALTALFVQLLANAIAYRRREVPLEVRVSAAAEDGLVRITVADNGCGIAPEYHQLVFEPLKKLDAGVPGAGLGLAIVKALVERQGGRVWVESAAGQGARFHFTLPAA